MNFITKIMFANGIEAKIICVAPPFHFIYNHLNMIHAGKTLSCYSCFPGNIFISEYKGTSPGIGNK
jgi:hypothetical protein